MEIISEAVKETGRGSGGCQGDKVTVTKEKDKGKRMWVSDWSQYTNKYN